MWMNGLTVFFKRRTVCDQLGRKVPVLGFPGRVVFKSHLSSIDIVIYSTQFFSGDQQQVLFTCFVYKVGRFLFPRKLDKERQR